MVTVDVFDGHVKGVLLKVMSVGGSRESIVIGAAIKVHPLASIMVMV
jgi:hypothetical protein